MAHQLMQLPYADDALAPVISKETISFHHGKHHNAYVTKLNGFLEGTGLENMPLDELITQGLKQLPADKQKAVFNNAAQVYNHNFYWNSLTPNGGEPSASLAEKLTQAFGSVDDFKQKFNAEAAGHFGSGWAWLVDNNGQLEITSTHDADNPLTKGQKPLLTCDVWEHAYYIDYRNARPQYLESFWKLANWETIEKNLG